MPVRAPAQSRPPSDPRPLPPRPGADWGGDWHDGGGPARLQMVFVVVLGVVLVAVPLYLWRRPRSVADSATASALPEAGVLSATVEVDAGPPPGVRLSDPRVLSCQDPGTKKTPNEQCDALPAFEKSFEDAILNAKGCVPAAAGPGTITYVADVSFNKKHTVTVSLPKDGRSYRGVKSVSGCAAAVRASMSGVSLDPIPHAHGRYKVAIVATYPAATDAGN